MPESSNKSADASALIDRLGALSPQRLQGMRRGVEKESLRSLAAGGLALTPHPQPLGSALMHPSITTDYSESQLELITGAHRSIDQTVDELHQLHQFTAQVLREHGDEMMWVSSMPCGLPTDETIPIGRYGTSPVGRAKSVYRMGLAHRYGRRMQTISGIHYNWSLPGLGNDEYFALIRNFRRHSFLLLTLLGASPAVCPSFVEGRSHELQRLSPHTLYLPYATTLRMGRLGYQSDAQASLQVSYNGLDGYAQSLYDALTQPYPAYERVGVRNPGGDYNQLATTLLQIENEFYSTIRPKRTIERGERPLHALRQRGVEYVEVRLIDLDPFEPLGISAATMRLLDVFLLHCLLSDSPPDSPKEIVALQRNQLLAASRGREPGLMLEQPQTDGSLRSVSLQQWGQAVLADMLPIAQRLDALANTTEHAAALAGAVARLAQPDLLPSARVLKAVEQTDKVSFTQFTLAQSRLARDAVLTTPVSADLRAHFGQLAERSLAEQSACEAADTMGFEAFRQSYLDPRRLGLDDMPLGALEAV
jgi:glutamate--cysteine ligase